MNTGVLIRTFLCGSLLGGAHLAALDQQGAPTVGFEFGVGYNMPFDDRFEGASTSFALVFPIGDVIAASIYHENIRLRGDEDGATEDVDGMVNQVRISARILNLGSQDVRIFLGLGLSEFDYASAGEEETGIVGDVGAALGLIRSQSGPVIGAASLEVLARFAPHDDVVVPGFDADEPVESQNALRIGLTAGVYF